MSNVVVYVLIGLLVVSLAGFGIGNFSTSVRAVGSVGDEDITVDDYVRALQAEINSLSQLTGTRISADQAIGLGLDRQALERLLLQAAIDNEASQLGISVGDETVLESLRTMTSFQGIDGNFDRDSYEFFLERNGLSHAEFDTIVRQEETRNIVRSSIGDGIQPSSEYLNDRIERRLNTRDFRWVAIVEDDLPEPVPDSKVAELRSHYDENPDEFTDPEFRDVTYVWLTPEMLSTELKVDVDAVRAEYDARTDEYDIPARRIADRVVFPNMQEAESARKRLDEGEIGFSGLLEERRIALEDAEVGEIRREDLSEDAASLLFDSSDTGLFGPVESELGPAIYRVNAVLEARFTPFEDASEELTEELSLELAESAIADNIENYEDLLAGGATLEEIAADTKLQLGSLLMGPDTNEGIAASGQFRNSVNSLTEDDFPELENMSDGGVFAARLNGIVPPSLRPFDKAMEDVAASWRDAKVEELLKKHAEYVIGRLKSGQGFAEIGFESQVEEGVRRLDGLSFGPPGMIDTVFDINVGDIAIVGEGQTMGVVQLDAINRVEMSSDEADSLRKTLLRRYTAATGNDVFRLYSEYLQKDAGIKIDHVTIDSIHTQLQ